MSQNNYREIQYLIPENNLPCPKYLSWHSFLLIEDFSTLSQTKFLTLSRLRVSTDKKIQVDMKNRQF